MVLCSFDGGDSTNLSVPDSSDFDHASSFTWEGYFYLIAYDSSASAIIRHENDGLDWYINTSGNIVFNRNTSTTLVQSGNGAFALNKWVHIAVSHTGSVCKIFVDGIEKASATTTDVPDNVSGILYIGETGDNNNYQWNGFISNLRFVNGTALYTTDFTPPTAPLTNVTNTKLLCCQSNTSATTAAVIPTGSITANGNAAATTFNPFNTDINTVRGQETGYATWNPLSVRDNVTFSEGNITLTNSGSGASGWRNVGCTQSVTSGKWYVEMHTIGSQNGGLFPGVCKLPDDQGTFNPATFSNNFPGMTANSYALNCFNGTKRTNGSDVSYGSAMALGDMIMMCLDLDNGAIWWGKNGVWFAGGDPAANSNAAFTGLAGEFVFACGIAASEKIVTNFGQKPFKFPPPTGFQPLNAANVRPETVITRPDHYVGVSLYVGTSGATSVDSLLFKPDLVWLKNRDNSDGWHQWRDVVRGGDKNLASNATNGETDASNKNLIFDPNGFTLTGTTDSRDDNYDGDDYVAWTWKAGGNKNTFNVDDVGYASAAAAGLTGGSITPTGASVGTKQGFSIIKYTGNSTANATLPHGLSEAPKFVIIKNLSNSYGWAVLHTDAGTTGTTLDGSPEYYMLQLDSNAARNDFSQDTIWNPTSTTVKIDQSGGANWVNNSNSSYIAYLWHDVPGLQKFGKYTGNGNADGPFIELGFRPAVVIVKIATGSDDSWRIYDNQRNKFNPTNNRLLLDTTVVEGQSVPIDFLSNGFKLRDSDGAGNGSGNTYVYCAWAEAPTFNLYGAQSNAR